MAFSIPHVIGVGGTIGSGALLGCFGYNRANYMFDVGMRFERFSASREFAMDQADMYREDLRSLSALTSKKNTVYADSAALGCALCVALYCAGRLGLHGPSPPNWIMGLWYTNNAAAFAFLVSTIWLAVHASGRAHAASVHLLTRKTRLPVPSLKQLDQARRFASEFEQQNWSDILRVPYVTDNGVPKTDAASSSRSRSQSAPPARRGEASSWVNTEWEEDRGAAAYTQTLTDGVVPEHFTLYKEVQKYWYQWDSYARVCFLMAILHFVHSLAYYGLGHINIELRCFWVAYAVGFILMVLHGLIMNFDLMKTVNKDLKVPPYCQWFAQVAWFFAAIGMSFDFKVQFDMTGIWLTWICIFIAYVGQLLYTVRLLEVVFPDEKTAPPPPVEQIGFNWFPQDWRLPSSFRHVLYLVAPPTRMQPGQNDILREVKEGTGENLSDFGYQSKGRAGADVQLWRQVEHVEHLLDWAVQEANRRTSSEQNKARVKHLEQVFTTARKSSPGPPAADPNLARACKEVIQGINDMRSEENLDPLKANDGSASDSAGSVDFDYGFDDDEAAPPEQELTRHQKTVGAKAKPAFLHTEHVEPWTLVASILWACVVAWVFLILGCIVDLVIGEQGVLTAPHWSRPPMTRASWEPHELGTPIGFPWAAGDKPYLPEQMAWHEEKRHVGSNMIGRRLGNSAIVAARSGMPGHIGISSALTGLVSTLGSSGSSAAPEPVSWPAFFEPRLLVCGPKLAEGGGSHVLAMTSRGFGAVAQVGGPLGASRQSARALSLAGLVHLPPILGASWGPLASGTDGLVLVLQGGQLVACPGPLPETGGVWSCERLTGTQRALPVAASGSSQLLAAAAAWIDGRLHAVLVDASFPNLAALFVHEGDSGTQNSGSWLPVGELQVPSHNIGERAPISLTLTHSGDLFVATSRGVWRQRLQDGNIAAASAGSLSSIGSGDSWQAACGLQHSTKTDSIAHLHMEATATSFARQPRLITSTLAALPKGHTDSLFFQ